MEQEMTTRDLVLRMIIRCNKVRKHKPKSVRVPQLTVDGEDSPTFSERLERKYFLPSRTRKLRESLQNFVAGN